MNMKKASVHYITGGIGFSLILTGLYFVKGIQNAQGMQQILPYLSVGFGCVIFGHGVGEILSQLAQLSTHNIVKQIEIEKNDERNLAISYRAKGKAYDIMVPVFGALLVSFGLMGVDRAVIILTAVAYVFICGCGIYYRSKFEKVM